MVKKLKRLFAMLLAVSMTMSLLSVTAFAEEETDGEIQTPTETEVVDPYIYYYNSYDVNVSPHFIGSAGHWTMLFRLDDENLGAINEADRQRVGAPAYCSDIDTALVRHLAYKRINLEDSSYYDDDAAASIRGIFEYGYWPGWDLSAAVEAANDWLEDENITVSTGDQATDPETGDPIVDENGDPVMEVVQAEIKNMTNAEALTATQAAIWHFANDVDAGDLAYNITGSESYMKNNCDSTTYDPVSVDYTEGSRDTTGDNINLFTQYLINQKAVAPDEDEILFSDSSFVSTSAAFTTAGDTNYDVTVAFKLVGEVEDEDDLTITATLGTNTITKTLGSNGLAPNEHGDYIIVFEDISYEDIDTEDERKVTLNLSGTQQANGVYFYEAKPSEGESGRDISQNLVGKYTGTTIVSATAEVSFDVGTKEIALYKYDASRETELGENETTVTVKETAYAALEGVTFDFYAKDSGGATYLLKTDLKTDAKGMISIKDLPVGYDYYFVETATLAGYKCTEGNHFIQWPDGTVTVENCYEVGNLSLEKKIEGVPTDDHFTFEIELDYSSAALKNAANLLDPTFDATWGGNYGCTENSEEVDGEGNPVSASIHNDTVTFEQNGNKLTARVQLKDGETLTLSGIPTGTAYTITEVNSLGYTSVGTGNTGEIGVNSTKESTYTNSLYVGTTAALEAAKVVDGGETKLEDGAFTFVLEQWDGEVWNEIDSAENNADGEVIFDSISISAPQADTYYRISEVAGDGLFVYDTSIYYAKLHVLEKDGVLSAEPIYYKNWSDSRKVYNELDGIPTFDNESYDSASIQLDGEKYLDGSLSTKAFTFVLTDVTNGASKQLGTTQNLTEGANQGKFTFDLITYTEPGTYKYEVSERNVGGYNCDKTVYTVTVNVSKKIENGEAKLVVDETVITYPVEVTKEVTDQETGEATTEKVTEFETADSIVFKNTTESSGGGSSSTYWQLKGTKTLDGDPAGGYTFQMADSNGKVLGTVTSKSNGSITFPKQTYTKTGTYIYTISEVAGDEDGIIYDDTVYTVKVTVEKVKGEYKVTEELISINSYTVVDAVAFENKTEVEEIPDEEVPQSPGKSDGLEELDEPDVPLATVPKTGDMSALWMAVSALSGTGLAAVSFLGRKKRDEE